MYEKEHHEDNDGNEVGPLEELVVSISLPNQPKQIELAIAAQINLPNRSYRHDCQVTLCNQCNYSGPIHDGCFPLLHHVSFPDVVDDKGKSVN